MQRRNRNNADINERIQRINEGRGIVLDLTDVIQQEVNRLLQQRRNDSAEESSSSDDRRRRRPFVRERDEERDARYDDRVIDQERYDQILANPAEYIQFVFHNRRFKLIPNGTIEPVPKTIVRGENGALYYWKTHGKPLSVRLRRAYNLKSANTAFGVRYRQRCRS